MNIQTPIEIPMSDGGIIEVAGARYMRDAAGRLVPTETVKPQHALEDQTVRKMIAFAIDLSAQIARFRGHTFDDVTSFVELLAEQYGDSRGGAKGNITLTSYDNCLKVVVQAQDQITFGAELQVAKNLVDACITEWAEGAAPNLRALVEYAFHVDKEGRINRSALFALRRLEIIDAQWKAAMQAIADAVRVVGSKEYVRFYRRAHYRARWEPITIDLAQAAPTTGGAA